MTTPEMPADTPDMVLVSRELLDKAAHALGATVLGPQLRKALSASPLGASGEGALAPLVPTEQSGGPVVGDDLRAFVLGSLRAGVATLEGLGVTEGGRIGMMRQAITALSAPSTTSTAEQVDKGNHDCLAKRRPGEPMFILLGRDPDAHNIVRLWAERRLAAGGDPEHCQMGLETAARMMTYASDPANAPASAPPASAYAPTPGEGEAPVAYGAPHQPWCQPGDQPHRAFRLRFDDPDMREMIWTGPDAEAEALAAYNQYAPTWNVYLFSSHPRPRPTPAAPEGLRLLQALLDHVDQETCAHEDTHRGGTIWTICDGCGRKWADDEGGFKPHKDAPPVAAARRFLAALQPQAQGGE